MPPPRVATLVLILRWFPMDQLQYNRDRFI
jgi:hypothetical protein